MHNLCFTIQFFFVALVRFIQAGIIPSNSGNSASSAVKSNMLLMNLTDGTNRSIIHGRRKRFDYEDNYEWEDDDVLTYESYYSEEETEPNFFQKVALHWRTAGPRLVFLGAFLILVILICCGCLRLACRFWCKSMEENCACCCMPGVKQTCQMCYTDPMYERVKDLGEAMGIQISFNTYEMIKERYASDTGFDPAAMPLLL